jgi:polysaccharide deacetylase family protein (PEP-CTERM system associated)
MVLNALTIDLEDWYQGIEQPFKRWGDFQERLHIGTDRLLEILDQTDTKATFFALGWLAEKYPSLMRRLAESGHEIASHGYDHEKLYNSSPDRLRQVLGRAKMATEDAVGLPVYGHRAPYFSLTQNSLWAIEILAELGFKYDSSVYSGVTWRYGIPGSPETPYLLGQTNIVEIPVSTFQFLNRRVGIGGAYFRILPLRCTRNAVRQLNAKGKSAVMYLHPWEFDPKHPFVRFPWKAMATHYFNLRSTAPRLSSLLRTETFASMADLLDIVGEGESLPRFEFTSVAGQ